MHSAFYGIHDEDEFFRQMVENKRLVMRLRVSRTYGVVLDKPLGS